jgi:hypothetical protein
MGQGGLDALQADETARSTGPRLPSQLFGRRADSLEDEMSRLVSLIPFAVLRNRIASYVALTEMMGFFSCRNI